MWQTRFTKALSIIVCVVLTAAMALFMIGCNDNNTPTGGDTAVNSGGIKGDGATVFPFEVTLPDGTKTVYEIHTDKPTVGEALLALGLIAGEQGDYGLYVKTVDGVTLDYNRDGKYWAFYIDGEYAMSGVDVTPITAGETYAFKAENA